MLVPIDQWDELPVVMGIYRIVQVSKEREYIGSSQNIRHRAGYHVRELRRGVHHSAILQRSFKKYGAADFAVEVIEEIFRKDIVLAREQFHIDSRKPMFNVAPVAENCSGVKHTEETRRKRSAATIRVWASMSPEKKAHRAALLSKNERERRANLTELEKMMRSVKARAATKTFYSSLTPEERAARHAKTKEGLLLYFKNECPPEVKRERARKLLAFGNQWRATAPLAVKLEMTAKMTATKRRCGKLNEEKVREIRALASAKTETFEVMGQRLGVCIATIHAVVHHRIWKDV